MAFDEQSIFIGARPRTSVCGICGRRGKMSRAHVPPRAAGNRDEVLRFRPRPGGRTRLPQDGQRGGLWIETICTDCNSLAGAKFDGAYADFSRRLRPFTETPGARLDLNHGSVPPVNVAPGLVSRSMLCGLLAVNPQIRSEFPGLAAQLLDDDAELRIPGRLQLRMALTGSRLARLTSGFWMFTLGNEFSHAALSEVWFRPLAFALVYTDWGLGTALVDALGWADITDWPLYARERTSVDLRNIVPRLPLVSPPQIADAEPWIALLNHERCLRLEGYLPG